MNVTNAKVVGVAKAIFARYSLQMAEFPEEFHTHYWEARGGLATLLRLGVIDSQRHAAFIEELKQLELGGGK